MDYILAHLPELVVKAATYSSDRAELLDIHVEARFYDSRHQFI